MTDPRDNDAEPNLTIIRDGDFLPFDHTAEVRLLGWAIKDPLAIATMQKFVKADDFDHPALRALMERVFAKYEADKPVTPLTLAIAVKSNTDIMELAGSVAGIEPWLHDVRSGAPIYISEADLERQVTSVAKSISDLRIRRWAIDGVVDTIERLRMGDDVGDSLAPIVSVADQEAQRSDHAHGSELGYVAADELLEDLERDALEGKQACSTGLIDLNEILGGLYQSNLIFVGGRPGMGKTIVGTTFAEHGCLSDFEVDYFSLEMTRKQLVGRILCDIDYDRAFREHWAPIQYSRVQMRRLSDPEKVRLAEARNVFAEKYADMEIHDRDELTMSNIASICRAKAARVKKPQLIIIDHMHLIEPSNIYRGRKVDEISEITKGAKRLAKRLDACVVMLAQLSRDVDKRENKAPQLSDFRDSGSIEQDGDILIGLHRPSYYLEQHTEKDPEKEAQRQAEAARMANVLQWGILKNRHGATGQVSTFVDVACSAIRDDKPLVGGQIVQERLAF